MEDRLYFPDKSKIAFEILTYLLDHPDAQDTLEGIVEWWLLERKIKFQTSMVKEALIELVQKGLVLEKEGRDSRKHYRTNQNKQEAIRALLRQSQK